MNQCTSLMIAVFTLLLQACTPQGPESAAPAKPAQGQAEKAGSLKLEQETYFGDMSQLTFGGQNAEAYFSYDGSKLIFQSTREELKCDAIFEMAIDGSGVTRLSSGEGVTTCSFISPDNSSIIYSSTHLGGTSCPPKPDYSKGYVWPLYKDYDVFKASRDGTGLKQLTSTDGYDAEAVFSPNGRQIIFTSVRGGDLDLYLMDPDGANVQQITNEPGYDGGAFFSFDGEWIVWRASRPKGEA